jgi:hypothetical protein
MEIINNVLDELYKILKKYIFLYIRPNPKKLELPPN